MVAKKNGAAGGVGGSGGGGGAVGGQETEVVVNINLQELIDKLCELLGENPDSPIITKLCELIATLTNEEGETAITKLCEILNTLVTTEGESLISKVCKILDILIASQDCTKPLAVKLMVDVTRCCTGGATAGTAMCANIPASWTERDLGTFDRCNYSFGGISLPDDSYTFADFEALITGVGGTIEPDPNNATQYKICVPDGFNTCYQAACFRGNVGQISRACVIALPNTATEVCKDFIDVLGKYDEPIGNILASMLDVQQQSLEKHCLSEAKQCLILDALTGACPNPVAEPIIGTTTAILDGDLTNTYTEGTMINITDATGASLGTATVTGSTFNGSQTTVTYSGISEETILSAATSIKPVSVQTVAAINTIKSIKGLG